MMEPEIPIYLSFLLRLWRVEPGGEQAGGWRASLERVGSGELRGFTSLKGLFEYLQQITQPPDELPGRRANGEGQNEGS